MFCIQVEGGCALDPRRRNAEYFAPPCRIALGTVIRCAGVRRSTLGHDGHVDAVADLTLWPSERGFSLPAEGTPSMLLRFGGPGGVTLGVRATDSTGVAFAPGTDHSGVKLVFWAEEAKTVVAVGSQFDVWYGGDIGSGSITEIR